VYGGIGKNDDFCLQGDIYNKGRPFNKTLVHYTVLSHYSGNETLV